MAVSKFPAEWEMGPEVIVGIEAKVDIKEIQTHTNVEPILRNLILHHCSLQFHLTLLVNLLFRLSTKNSKMIIQEFEYMGKS